MQFIINTNSEVACSGYDIEDELQEEATDAASTSAADKLTELVGKDAYTKIAYDGNFRNWDGGKYDKCAANSKSAHRAWTRCGFVCVDIDSPSAREIAHAATDAYIEALTIFI